MILNSQKPIDFNSPSCVIYDQEELKKAIIWYSKPKPVCRLKHVYLHGNYYAVSIYDKKIHVHRLLMMFWLKRDLQRNEHVHHKNHNKYDNRKENLELILASDHMSMTNKGKALSSEHKNKISEAGKKRKGIKIKKRININLNEISNFLKNGFSINKIAKHFNCDWTTIRARIYENPELLPEEK